MSLRHALLGLLLRQPSTGYELTKMFDVSLRTSWHAGHSQIYPELAKLERAGHIEVVSRGPRGSKTWAITPAGTEELTAWLVDATPDRSVRNESGLRLFLTQLLPAAQRRAAFSRDLAHVEEEIVTMSELQHLAQARVDEPFLPQLELGIRINTVIRDWLHEQLARTQGTPDA